MTWSGIFENILSDIIFLLLGIVLTGIWLHFSYRKKLFKFFGLDDSKKLIIFLSNLQILPFGSVGMSGRKYSYQGNAVIYQEMLLANEIRNLFLFIIPPLANLSKKIGQIIFSDVEVLLKTSPNQVSDIDNQNTILSFGSPAYNKASEYIESLDINKIQFTTGSITISALQRSYPGIRPSVMSSSTDQGIYEPASLSNNGTMDDYLIDQNGHEETKKPKISFLDKEYGDLTIGIVEKLFDSRNHQTLFYVAGLSEHATIGAANYLKSHWYALNKKYKNNTSFLIVLKFNENDYKSCELKEEILIRHLSNRNQDDSVLNVD